MGKHSSVWLLLIALPACNQSTPKADKPVELETVDIGGGIDAELTTDNDERARRAEIDLGGVLPSDFPPGMPVFSPASVVDFGAGFVVLDTPVSTGEVQSSLGAQIKRAGWTVDSIGDGGSHYRREGRQVKVTLTDLGSGTRIHYEY